MTVDRFRKGGRVWSFLSYGTRLCLWNAGSPSRCVQIVIAKFASSRIFESLSLGPWCSEVCRTRCYPKTALSSVLSADWSRTRVHPMMVAC